MTIPGEGRRAGRGWAAALGLLVVVLFVYTVRARTPWFGEPADGRMFWLTAHTWKTLENWWEEGAIASRFLVYDNPRSVELLGREDRVPYTSYPPGAFLPPYALAKLTGTRPSVALIMGYDLANHLAIAALLAALGFAMARSAGLEPRLAALTGSLPASIVLLAPGPMYWLQNVYFADQAVILPFVLALALEWARPAGGALGRWSARLSPGVVLWGCLVDYLFVFVTLALFIGRWLCGEYGLRSRARRHAALRFCVAPALALGLFALHLAAADGFRMLIARARWRAGAPRGEEAHPLLFWVPFARQQYGATGVVLLGVATLALAGVAIAMHARAGRSGPAGERIGRVLGLGTLALAPCVAQLLALRQHSSIHDFSVLKLVVPLALLPFVVLPLVVVEWRRRRADGTAASGRAGLAVLIAGAATVAYLAVVHPGYAAQFPPPTVRHAAAAELLRRECGYGDIVFSPHRTIDPYPPQLLAISRKRVYAAASPRQLRRLARQRTAGIDEPYRICLLFAREVPAEWRPLLRGLRAERARGWRLFCGVRVTEPQPASAARAARTPR